MACQDAWWSCSAGKVRSSLTEVSSCDTMTICCNLPGTMENLFLASRVLLRLSVTNAESMPTLLDLALNWLRAMEPSVSLAHPLTQPSISEPFYPEPPHTAAVAKSVEQIQRPASDIVIWGRVVEALWRVCMTVERGSPAVGSAWNGLTSRLLVWNAMERNVKGGREPEAVGEWARREALRNLRSH